MSSHMCPGIQQAGRLAAMVLDCPVHSFYHPRSFCSPAVAWLTVLGQCAPFPSTAVPELEKEGFKITEGGGHFSKRIFPAEK